VVEGGADQGHLLAHALAEAAHPDPGTWLQPEDAEQFVDALFAGRGAHPLHPAEEVEVFRRGHPFVKPGHLGQQADLGAHRLGVVGH